MRKSLFSRLSSRKSVLFSVFGTGLTFGVMPLAIAYPFNPNPDSFASYLNSMSWDDGSRNYFQNLHNCLAIDKDKTLADSFRSWNNPLIQTPTYQSYLCMGGFVTITDPQGSKTCKVSSVAWDGKSRRTNFSYSNCRYK